MLDYGQFHTVFILLTSLGGYFSFSCLADGELTSDNDSSSGSKVSAVSGRTPTVTLRS